MKKLIIKSVLMVCLMVAISNYALYIMTGKSPFNSAPEISFSTPSKEDIKRSVSGGKETVFKWTDAQGKVHYSNEPPKNAELAQKLEVNPNANLIQGIKLGDAKKPARPQAPTIPSGANIYHPESVKKLVNDAKNVQKLLDDRNEATQKALENL